MNTHEESSKYVSFVLTVSSSFRVLMITLRFDAPRNEADIPRFVGLQDE